MFASPTSIQRAGNRCLGHRARRANGWRRRGRRNLRRGRRRRGDYPGRWGGFAFDSGEVRKVRLLDKPFGNGTFPVGFRGFRRLRLRLFPLSSRLSLGNLRFRNQDFRFATRTDAPFAGGRVGHANRGRAIRAVEFNRHKWAAESQDQTDAPATPMYPASPPARRGKTVCASTSRAGPVARLFPQPGRFTMTMSHPAQRAFVLFRSATIMAKQPTDGSRRKSSTAKKPTKSGRTKAKKTGKSAAAKKTSKGTSKSGGGNNKTMLYAGVGGGVVVVGIVVVVLMMRGGKKDDKKTGGDANANNTANPQMPGMPGAPGGNGGSKTTPGNGNGAKTKVPTKTTSGKQPPQKSPGKKPPGKTPVPQIAQWKAIDLLTRHPIGNTTLNGKDDPRYRDDVRPAQPGLGLSFGRWTTHGCLQVADTAHVAVAKRHNVCRSKAASARTINDTSLCSIANWSNRPGRIPRPRPAAITRSP